MASITALPDDFPWDKTVGLLLDALQVKNLLQFLYELAPTAQIDLLYQGTQWESISHCSPCLVRLQGCDDPLLLQFLANTQNHWGYLLVSDGSWQELVAHMRWLTSFKPPRDEEMFLRISDPGVANALFAADLYPGAELFGPCQSIIAANTPLPGWTQYRRPGQAMLPSYGEPYMASDAQWAALKAAVFYKSLKALYQHMQRFFPQYRADLTPEQRFQHIHEWALSAMEKGFTSEREIWLYASVVGFLGDEVMQQHQDISELLTVSSELTTYQRVDRAAALAAQRRVQ